jgi:hypothetical protein
VIARVAADQTSSRPSVNRQLIISWSTAGQKHKPHNRPAATASASPLQAFWLFENPALASRRGFEPLLPP